MHGTGQDDILEGRHLALFKENSSRRHRMHDRILQ